MFGGRKSRSNKGKKRGQYGPRSGVTRSGRKFRNTAKKVNRKNVKRTRKTRSNKGRKRGPYGPRSRTRSGRKFRGGYVLPPNPTADDYLKYT